MQYATCISHISNTEYFHCNVSLWKQLMDVLGVGLEYFLDLALNTLALALNTKSFITGCKSS